MTTYKKDIVLLREQGKTYNEIKNILGCSKGTIAYHLGEGQKEKNKARQDTKRAEIYDFLYSYKEKSGCMDCGEKYPYFVLQFDHLHSKEFSLSKFGNHTASLSKVKEEVEKCEVVCANCHSIRTYLRKDNVKNKKEV